MKQLTALEKGRIILKFMQKRSKPFENRHFYKHFFSEHEKAEKIHVLENFSKKIQTALDNEKERGQFGFVQPKDPSLIDEGRSSIETMQNFLHSEQGFGGLNLNYKHKKMIINSIKLDDQSHERYKAKKMMVQNNKDELMDVMKDHH